MDELLSEVIRLLIAIGPWIVFAVCLSETAVFLGLLIPAEATVLVAAFLANRGYFPVEHVLAGTFFGGLAGDQLGYVFGRTGGTRMTLRDGRIGRLSRRAEAGARRMFQRHAAVAVTLARFLSFVRTLMPWFAGMSGMPYGRFLAYDLVGVLGWAAGSVAAGYLAGESWRAVASVLGSAGAAALVLILGGIGAAAWRARRSPRTG